jgi:diguanylate cyclase (GGDEF)-like protein
MALVQRDITERKWFDEQISMQICHVQEARVELEAQQQELAAANQRLAQMNIELEALATTDGLTGVRNHRAFQEKLQEEFRRQQRYGGSFSLLLLDVDSFKKFNDSFGHPAGDEVLKQVATLLKMSARQTDYAARYGGEEFALILPETDEHGALVLAERIRAAIEEAAWEKRPVTISVGVSTISREINTPAALIASADEALYTSKARGRNCVTHHRSLLAKAA